MQTYSVELLYILHGWNSPDASSSHATQTSSQVRVPAFSNINNYVPAYAILVHINPNPRWKTNARVFILTYVHSFTAHESHTC